MNYSDSFVTRNWKWSANTTGSQPFRWDNSNGTTRAQFGGSGYDPIAPTAQGLQGTDGRYSVREGDTLAGIAASVWGDASLWYLIAEANGLSGAESLPAGTSLIVPDKVVNVHNSAKTFDVYDPNHAAGDLSPTEAKPPKKTNNCGLFGTILVMVVAVVATHYLGPIGGNLVTQGFANLIGQQKGFSWKSLAISWITANVTQGIDASGVFAAIGNATVQAAATAITANAVTQGIGVAVGLQKKFDFAAVAAAGAGAAASAQIRMPGPGGNMLRTAADAIAGAATRSLVTGTSFGDNIMAVLPDVIGRSIGNAMADALSGAKSAGQLLRESDAHEAMHGAQLSGAGLSAPGVTTNGSAGPVAGVDGGKTHVAASSPDADIAASVTTPATESSGAGPGEAEGETIVITALKPYRGVHFSPADVQMSAFILGAYDNPVSAEYRLGALSLNHLGNRAGTPGSLSSRVLGENRANWWRLNAVTAFLEQQLPNFEFGDAFSADVALLRAAVNLNEAQFDRLMAQEAQDWRTALIDAGSYSPTPIGAVLNGIKVINGVNSGEMGIKDAIIESIPGRVGKVGRLLNRSSIDPHAIRFSQENIGKTTRDGMPIPDLIENMRKHGWKGDPIDVVRMPDGSLTSLDNRRLFAAREAGINVEANIRGFGEILPADRAAKLTNRRTGISPRTWGEAISIRIGNQPRGFGRQNPYGSHTNPRIRTGR